MLFGEREMLDLWLGGNLWLILQACYHVETLGELARRLEMRNCPPS